MARVASAHEIQTGFNKLKTLNRNNPQQGFKIKSDRSSEKWGYYFVHGEPVFHLSEKARGHGDVSGGRLKQLIEDSQVTARQFFDLCQCRLTGPQYHALIEEKHQQGMLPLNPRSTPG